MSTLAKIEALLFVAGEDGIRVRQLAELLSLPPTGIQQSLEKLAQKYEKDPDSSLALIETGGAYRLVTKPQFSEILKEYSKAPINQSLSRAALWDLVHHCLQTTHHTDRNWCHPWGKLEWGFGKVAGFWPDKGRREKRSVGAPNLYVTTDYFLDYMGINHLEELPVIDELEIQAQESQLFGERIEEDENQ